MQRYSEVIGLPVISIENGKKVGSIGDVIFSPLTKEIIGFSLEKRGCEIGIRGVLLKDVVSLGNDALIIKDFTCIAKLKKNKPLANNKKPGEVRGLKIYTRTGEDLGVVKDVLFDYKTGVIEGFEISDGLLQDIVKGRNILPLFGKVEFSDESILVDKEAIEEMTATGGGIKNLLNKIGND